MRPAGRTLDLVLLGLCALAGCRGADTAEDLELVARTAEAEAGALPHHVLVARCELAEVAAGAVELWLPLPRSDEFQTVKSLAVEVGPPGTYRVEEQAGERLLHVEAPGATQVTLRALIERSRAALPSAALPPALADLPADPPAAFVAAATARGATARVMTGVPLDAPDGAPVRWAEVLVDGAWVRVGQPAEVRLGPELPRATVDGQPVPVRTCYALRRP